MNSRPHASQSSSTSNFTNFKANHIKLIMLTLQDILKLSFHPLFFLPLLTFIFLYLWLSTTTHTKNSNSPPSPPKLPILGNLHQFDKLLHRSFHFLSRRYGDIMLVHIGSKPIIIISSAEAAQEIMKTHDTIFANRPNLRVARKILYDGKDIAFANYGEYWRQMKSICTLHLFSNTKVRSFRRVREEEASLMVEDIRKSIASNEGVVNLSDYFIRITNDVVCKAAFGRRYTGGKGCPNLKELLNDFSEALGSFCLQDFIPWLGWIDYISGVERKADKVAKALDGFIESIVEEHSGRVELKGGSDDGQDLVEVLLQIQKENSSSLSKESIKAILLDMVAGGTDTTFTLLEWVMTELLMHPQAMKRLQDEVRQTTQSKQRVDEDDLKEMKYLKSVIKETLRLHPPLPLLLPRESSQDTKIKGYDIPARTQVIINAWAIHRDPANWENPEEFRPERFLNSALDYKGQDLSYIPFGAGRRGCPGVLFAIMDAEFAVANLVHEFDWKLPAGEEIGMSSAAENAGTTVRRRDPLLAIPTPYRSM